MHRRVVHGQITQGRLLNTNIEAMKKGIRKNRENRQTIKEGRISGVTKIKSTFRNGNEKLIRRRRNGAKSGQDKGNKGALLRDAHRLVLRRLLLFAVSKRFCN